MLPARIQDKITVDDHDHWVWTGYSSPARQVKRQNILRGKYDSPNAKPEYVCNVPPIPRASHEGSSRPAIRVILSHTLGIPYTQVPTARRLCTHPLCVNPDHYQCQSLDVDVLALLRTHEPLPELGPVSAAQEINVPSIPEPIWAQYLRECPDA